MPHDTKSTINLDAIESAYPKTAGLVSACFEYINKEHYTKYRERERYYNKNLQQRLRTGDSLCVRITETEQSGNMITGQGTLYYDWLPYNNAEKVIQSISRKGAGKTSGGDRMVGVPLNAYGEPQVEKSYKIPQQVKFTIKDIDLQSGTITLQAITYNPYPQSKYEYWHPQPTIDPADATNDSTHYIEPDTVYILDPGLDNITASRIETALSVSDTNDTVSLLNQLIHNKSLDPVTAFDQSGIEGFINWLESQDKEIAPGPNERQRDFITDTEAAITLLQGPPGTGKTSGAIAPAVLARLYGYNSDQGCRGLITGPSNKAIEEIIEDLAHLIKHHKQSRNTYESFDGLELIRLTSGDPEPSQIQEYDFVTYSTLYDDEATLGTLRERLLNPATGKDTLVFATPEKSWTIAKKITKGFDADELAEQTELTDLPSDNITPDDPSTLKFWDLFIVDEASMMVLPRFILAGAFYRQGGNILICGDHRQLPPVRNHEWGTDQSPLARKFVPYFSILDFARILAGDADSITELTDEQKDLLAIDHERDKPSGIATKQLEKTYRCHTDIAEFLHKWVYSRDDLDYSSQQTKTIPDPNSHSEGINETLSPESPLTVLTYRNDSYQQANQLEALITSHILSELPESVNAGAITPHSAQRGLLKSYLTNSEVNLNPEADIDTVERFQGGERDVILINATVSDPDYISSESEFLLNLNRLNVAISRMKQKIIIIASEHIFDHISLDPDEYNQTLLWKGITQDTSLQRSDAHAWEGPLRDYLGNIPINSKTVNRDEHLTITHFNDKP